MARKFEQTLHQDKENTKVVAIGQTRDGIDEWITRNRRKAPTLGMGI